MTEKPELEKAGEYSLNTKQAGEALELLSNLENNSVSLVFLDPQYEPVRQVLRTDYPLYSQSDYQILIKALISATTNQGDLIIDPCAGSFVVLEVCQELKREFLGCDLTFKELKEFQQKKSIYANP